MGRIRESLNQLLGKTISSVVVSKNEMREPHSQLFLIFDDGTSFEIWVNQDDFCMASKTDDENLEKVLSLLEQRSENRITVFESDLGRLIAEHWENRSSSSIGQFIATMTSGQTTPEQLLYLALHVRQPLLARLAQAAEQGEVENWANLLNASLASFIENSNIEDLDRLYQRQSRWNSIVRPPSVVEPELMNFLGLLSTTNTPLFDDLKKRGACQACLKLLRHDSFSDDAG